MKTDALGRRLRFAAPNPLVNRVIPTEADILLFEAINRHGPLSTHYLYEFTKHRRKDRSHLQNRLTEMYNGDGQGPYLTRPPQQFSSFRARYQHMVYDLTPKSAALLSRPPIRRSDPFLHRLMNACVSASIELTAGEHSLGYQFFNDRIAGHKVMPDGLFGLIYPNGKRRTSALEIDRNTESIKRKNLDNNTIGKKVKNYVDVFDKRLHQEWWGVHNFGVLIVTTNQVHAQNIVDYVGKHAGKWSKRFALKVVPDFSANWRVPKGVLSYLLDEPWLTVDGDKDLTIF